MNAIIFQSGFWPSLGGSVLKWVFIYLAIIIGVGVLKSIIKSNKDNNLGANEGKEDNDKE
ncbi:MAG: hypothetical protein LBN29_04020 [Mediterranea sp.]|jgi:hypothetical protein|nr:hypothetical protein [Mediterranea sp.]